MQGYLPVKMLADTIQRDRRGHRPSAGGFLDAGTEIVTADSVTEPFGLPPLTFEELEAIAADPDAAREYYQPLVDGIDRELGGKPRAHRERGQVARDHGGDDGQDHATGRPLPSLPGTAVAAPAVAVVGPAQALWRHPGPHRAWTSTSSRAPSTPSSARTAPASPRS